MDSARILQLCYNLKEEHKRIGQWIEQTVVRRYCWASHKDRSFQHEHLLDSFGRQLQWYRAGNATTMFRGIHLYTAVTYVKSFAYRHQAITLALSSQLVDRFLDRLLRNEPLPCLWDDAGWDAELGREEDEAERDSLKDEKKLRIARPIPPLPLDRLLVEDHEILLGAPLLLNPPSISVYTTGNSRSPALLPPENLPTANPPPGSRHIVSPTVSSSFPAAAACSSPSAPVAPCACTSVGSSWRQTGHEFRSESHGKMQSWW